MSNNEVEDRKPKIELYRDSDGYWSILAINDEVVESAHSIQPDDVLKWLYTNGYIEYNKYRLEDKEYTKDGIEILYDDMRKWLQDQEDEFPTKEYDG